MGTAMCSASPRSLITCWLFEAIMGAEPPTSTSVPSPRSWLSWSTSSVEISVCSAKVPSMCATTMPVRPSSELSGSLMPGSLKAWTDSMPSCSRRSAAISSPTSAESAAWEPSGARTRTTRLASPADLFVHDLLCPGGFRSRVGVAAAGNVARETTPASVLVGAEVARPGDGSCARSRSAPRPGPEGREQMRDHRARDHIRACPVSPRRAVVVIRQTGTCQGQSRPPAPDRPGNDDEPPPRKGATARRSGVPCRTAHPKDQAGTTSNSMFALTSSCRRTVAW